MTQFRIYGKSRKIGRWLTDEERDQMTWKEVANYEANCIREVDYDEYRFYEDGTITHSVGTEDFSVRRASREMHRYEVLAWYGDLNKGGHKAWSPIETVTVTTATPAQLKKLYSRICFANELQVRKIG